VLRKLGKHGFGSAMKALRRNQKAADALVGTLRVVVLNPFIKAGKGLLKTAEVVLVEQFQFDPLVQSLNLPQGLRMVRAGMGVINPLMLQVFFKPIDPTPRVKNKAAIRQ